MKNRSSSKSFRYGGPRLWLLLLAVVLMAPVGSNAARPLITDDAGTVGKGKTQIELSTEWFSWEDTRDGQVLSDNLQGFLSGLAASSFIPPLSPPAA